VEVQKTAYQAQYGRFTGGLTSVRTKAPLNQWNWELNDFIPSPRIKSGQIVGIANDVPRLSFTGPILSDKLSFSESFMYSINKQPVRGLAWPHNEIKRQGFDSFTDLYYVSSPQNLVTANLKVFPLREQYANIDSFIQQSASSDYAQSGFALGATDRYMFSNGGVLTTLFQHTDFDSYAHGQGPQDMVLTPDNWEGNFFNAWTRASSQQELLQNYQSGKKNWAGRHIFKVGGDFVHRSYNDVSKSHPVQLLRPDGSLAELITFQGAGVLKAEDTELAAFAQDHWALNDQIALDYGVRYSGQTLGEHAAFAPVDHVYRDDDVAAPGQVAGPAPPRVGRALELRERRVLVLRRDDLLLAPREERPVVVQRHDRRPSFPLSLRQQKIRRHANVGRRVEVNLLAHVIAAVRALDHLGLRIAHRRVVLQEAAHLAPRLLLPRLHVAEPVVEKRKVEGRAAGGLFNERVQAADLRVGDRGLAQGVSPRIGRSRRLRKPNGGRAAALPGP